MYSPEFIKDCLEYQNKFKDCKYSFLDVNIYHLYHGDIGRRRYIQRHGLLKKHNYNKSSLRYNEDGIIYLEDQNLKNEIEEYFNTREKI
jgi:hypothetical protein